MPSWSEQRVHNRAIACHQKASERTFESSAVLRLLILIAQAGRAVDCRRRPVVVC